MLSGNAGEWSEIYVFLKLLAEGKLYAADANLKKIENIYYPIVQILRNLKSSSYSYSRNSHIKVIDSTSKTVEAKIPIDAFIKTALILFDEIKSKSGSFTCSEIESFLKQLRIDRLKANSADKKDITIVVHDMFVGAEKTLGFSIKSQIGSPSTLINAGKTTNFIFLAEQAAPNCVSDVNAIYNIKGKVAVKDRVKNILHKNIKISYVDMVSKTFKRNLQLIDTALPEILGQILIAFYSGVAVQIDELTVAVAKLNPCGFDNEESHVFYEYKIKNFLTDAALGMTPATVWSGIYDATGGYIVVKDDGDVLCYHIYNRNEFQNYLFKNTRLETASTSRHDFGSMYEENGLTYIKLNLQVRFNK